jgi:hypothetical protein
MKAFVLILLAASAGLFAGCETDMPAEPGRENPLQRGLRGEGQLVPLDRTDSEFPERDDPALR